MYTCMHRSGSEAGCFHLIFLRRDFSLNLELTKLAREQAPGIFLPVSPALVLQTGAAMPSFFWMLGFETISSELYWLSHLPNPDI